MEHDPKRMDRTTRPGLEHFHPPNPEATGSTQGLTSFQQFSIDHSQGLRIVGMKDDQMKEFLGEKWTDDELADARHFWSAINEGIDAGIPYMRALKLQERGLIKDVEEKPGRGRYANRYSFNWTDKLEQLVAADRTDRATK